jgi:hypothetical protein
MLLATIPSSMVITWKVQLLFGHRFLYIIQLYINAIVTRIMIEIKDIEKSFETKILKGISTILKPEKRTYYWTKWLW